MLLRDNIPTISDPNTWDTPGGYVEGGENFEECILRELNEELELNLLPERLKFLWESITVDEIIEQAFYVKLSDSEASLLKLHEGQELKFFSLEELKKLRLTRQLKTQIKIHWGDILALVTEHN